MITFVWINDYSLKSNQTFLTDVFYEKAFLSVILIIFFTNCYSQKDQNKNSFNLSIQAFGIPTQDIHEPGGCIVDLGYDIIPNHRQHVFSLEPRIGGGFMGNSLDNEFGTHIFKYTVTCIHFGIAPKVYLNLNMTDSDKSSFLYLENEFSLLNTYASINDYHVSTTRKENEYLHFFYSCKLGVSFPVIAKATDLWIGYTTLDFTRMLNKNIPQNRDHFAGEYLGACFGMSFHF